MAHEAKKGRPSEDHPAFDPCPSGVAGNADGSRPRQAQCPTDHSGRLGTLFELLRRKGDVYPEPRQTGLGGGALCRLFQQRPGLLGRSLHAHDGPVPVHHAHRTTSDCARSKAGTAQGCPIPSGHLSQCRIFHGPWVRIRHETRSQLHLRRKNSVSGPGLERAKTGTTLLRPSDPVADPPSMEGGCQASYRSEFVDPAAVVSRYSVDPQGLGARLGMRANVRPRHRYHHRPFKKGGPL